MAPQEVDRTSRQHVNQAIGYLFLEFFMLLHGCTKLHHCSGFRLDLPGTWWWEEVIVPVKSDLKSERRLKESPVLFQPSLRNHVARKTQHERKRERTVRH